MIGWPPIIAAQLTGSALETRLDFVLAVLAAVAASDGPPRLAVQALQSARTADPTAYGTTTDDRAMRFLEDFYPNAPSADQSYVARAIGGLKLRGATDTSGGGSPPS